MELTVYEGEKQVGTLRAEQNGLYYDIYCKIKNQREQIRRIFVGYAWRSEYLGIPDAQGNLTVRMPRKHLPEGITFAVATPIQRSQWLPWRGEVDGVPMTEGYIGHTENGIDLLLPPQEAVKLPAWAGKMQTETLQGREMMKLSLLPDGSLAENTTDRGEKTDEEIIGNGTADRMPDDDASRFSLSDEERQADRTDL